MRHFDLFRAHYAQCEHKTSTFAWNKCSSVSEKKSIYKQKMCAGFSSSSQANILQLFDKFVDRQTKTRPKSMYAWKTELAHFSLEGAADLDCNSMVSRMPLTFSTVKN